LDAEWFVPDPGQGALAIQTRAGDTRVIDFASAINDLESQLAVKAERSLLRAIGGGCHTPVGALATIAGGTLTLSAMIANPETGELRLASQSGSVGEAGILGERLADILLDRDATT
jgi:hydroxymethylbilane synthase